MTRTRNLTIDLRMFRHSGIGRYLRNLVPLLLPQLHADSIQVLAAPGLLSGMDWLADPRVHAIEVSAPVYSLSEQFLPLRSLYRNAGLLWVPHYNVPFAWRGPLAVTIHDLAPIALHETFTSSIKRRYARLLMENAVARAAAILTVSRFTADELCKLLHADPARITVTYPGIDESWPAANSAAPRKDRPGQPYFLYVGNVKPNKNLRTLLTAFQMVMDGLPHRLILAGRVAGFETEDEAVFKQAESLGDRIHWAGEVSDLDLIDLYRGASALVLPSLYEGFGLPLLEAMQLGCPVLSSNAASLPEIAGDAALYFDPRDPSSLAELLLQLTHSTVNPVADSLRQAGYRRVAGFSFSRCAAETASVLNPLLEKHT